ncbi:hypothetical protein BSLA_02f4182 [Burkholderia stabilis]|nr:hypothetical protein BSLA_02f4182 [Burkholderia stabilis]
MPAQIIRYGFVVDEGRQRAAVRGVRVHARHSGWEVPILPTEYGAATVEKRPPRPSVRDFGTGRSSNRLDGERHA